MYAEDCRILYIVFNVKGCQTIHGNKNYLTLGLKLHIAVWPPISLLVDRECKTHSHTCKTCTLYICCAHNYTLWITLQIGKLVMMVKLYQFFFTRPSFAKKLKQSSRETTPTPS